MDTRRVLTLTAVAGTLLVAAAFGSLLLRGRPLEVYYWLYVFHNGPPGVLLLWLSRLVLLRRPGNGAGRVLLVMGLFSVTHTAVAAFTDLRLAAAGVSVALIPGAGLVPADIPPDASVPLWIMAWWWVPVAVLAVTLLPLLFPDGRLPGPRWRAVLVPAALGAALLVVAGSVSAWPTVTWREEEIPVWVDVLSGLGWLTVLAAATASLVALGLRWHRAEPARRRQFQVVGVTAALFALLMVGTSPWQHVWVPSVLFGLCLFFTAYALAVARYRLLYRRRADRTEVLSRLAARSSDAATAATVLGEVADLLVRGTGASRAEVVLDAAASPGGRTPEPATVAAGSTDEAEPLLRATVAHRGERFGELRLYAWAPSDLVSDARPLLEDVAHALGVVLRNERLTGQLHEQLDDLRESRQRLVEAHDRARRELERDIHDGAQARLVAVRLRVGALHALARNPAPASAPANDRLVEELEALAHEVDAAVRSLRDLSRGVYPPMLEQAGLPGALRAFVRDLPVPVPVTANGVGRYPRAVESAVYFCCLEAVQNAVRHSGAASVTVELHEAEGRFGFLVRDDGTGFTPGSPDSGHGPGSGLTNIDDRLRALGGRVCVDSAPGEGTRVTGRIPLQPLAEDR